MDQNNMYIYNTLVHTFCKVSRCWHIYNKFEVLTTVNMKSSIFWDIMPCSPAKSTDVSEEHTASIFRVKQEAKQVTSMKQTASTVNRAQKGQDLQRLGENLKADKSAPTEEQSKPGSPCRPLHGGCWLAGSLLANTGPDLSARGFLCLLPASCWFLVWLSLQLWRCRWYVPRNVGRLPPDYTVLQPRRQKSSSFIMFDTLSRDLRVILDRKGPKSHVSVKNKLCANISTRKFGTLLLSCICLFVCMSLPWFSYISLIMN
jgi:hypothetical protein